MLTNGNKYFSPLYQRGEHQVIRPFGGEHDKRSLEVGSIFTIHNSIHLTQKVKCGKVWASAGEECIRIVLNIQKSYQTIERFYSSSHVRHSLNLSLSSIHRGEN